MSGSQLKQFYRLFSILAYLLFSLAASPCTGLAASIAPQVSGLPVAQAYCSFKYPLPKATTTVTARSTTFTSTVATSTPASTVATMTITSTTALNTGQHCTKTADYQSTSLSSLLSMFPLMIFAPASSSICTTFSPPRYDAACSALP